MFRGSCLQNGHELENKLTRGGQLKLTFLSNLSNPLEESTIRWSTHSYHNLLDYKSWAMEQNINE
jgi:hypothetical protein